MALGRKPIMRWIVLALLVLGAGFVAFKLAGPEPVNVAALSRGPAVVAVYATGTVEPTVMMPIAPRVSGRLVQLKVDEGSQVRKGQLLARLEAPDVEASLGELQSRRRQAGEDLARAQDLLNRGVATRVARDRARTEVNALDAQISRTRAQLGFTGLVAPADGSIIRRDGEIGQLINVNQAVLWMSCCAPLRVTAEVDEEDVPLVKPGQRVLIRSDAFPDKSFEGKVDQITPKGDPVARSYRVRITVPTDTPLMIGMTTEANILIEQRDNALLAPVGAVKDEQVWVIQGGSVTRKAVKTGVASGARVEILSGLSGSEQVVVDPPATLKEGQRVRMEPWVPPATTRDKEGIALDQMAP
jgi:RND family efflux transporter MFP subunit